MSLDDLPKNCRFRLESEGKPYGKSGCRACGRSVLTGLGKRCHLAIGDHDYDGENLEDLNSSLKILKEMRHGAQQEIDFMLMKVQSLTDKKLSLTYDINRLKRIINENSKKDEGHGG